MPLRLVGWTPWLIGVAVFAAYAWFAAPGPYWLDSQELGAAAVRLGVPHPTGFPLFCVAGKLAALLPLGELAVRLHWASGACAAAAVGVSARLVLELSGEDGAGAVAATAAGLALAGSLVYFRQGTVTEVYASLALVVALSAWLALRLLRGGGARAGVALAFVAGLAGTGLHASYRLLFALPVLVLALWAWHRRARWLRAAFGLGVIGALGALVYLPLRSATGRVAALDWGHPSTLRGLWDHVTGARIRTAYAEQMLGGAEADLAGAAVRFAGLVEHDLGVVALLAALAGAAALVLAPARTPASRPLAILLVAVALGDLIYAAALNPMGTADRQNGVPFVLVTTILAGCGIGYLARALAGARFGKVAPLVAGALAVAVAFQPVVAGGDAKIAGAVSDAPRGWGEAALASTPPGGIALVRSDSLAALLLWLTEVEHARPDAAMLVRQHLWDRARNRAVLAAAGIGGEDPLAAGRPVAWELGDDAAPLPVAPGVPLGALAGRAAPAGLAEQRVARVFAGRATDDPPARREAARAWVNAGVLLAAAGQPDRAAVAAERAAALTPDSARALANAALYRSQVGDDARARVHAEAALAVDPRRALAWTVLGIAEARAGQFCRAVAAFDRALALDPGDRDARANRALAAPRCAK